VRIKRLKKEGKLLTGEQGSMPSLKFVAVPLPPHHCSARSTTVNKETVNSSEYKDGRISNLSDFFSTDAFAFLAVNL
jgi:hypothetical protein